VLQQIVGGDLDVLVPPFGGAVDAGDQPGPVDTAEIPVDERVPRLGLVLGAVRQPEVPGRVVVPAVRLEIGILRGGVGLDVTPVTVQYVLLGVDQLLLA